MVTELSYKTTQEAWEGINEYLLLQEKEIVKKAHAITGSQVIAYNVFIKAFVARVDPEFDFGNMFGYTMNKWRSLVNNYVNLDYLDIVKGQVLLREAKASAVYNEAMLFDNSHASGKGCLLSLVFSRRYGNPDPILTFNLRSSEVTKRLLFDYLLVQRLGEYVYGKNRRFSIELFCGNVYLDLTAFTMYDSHKSIGKLIGKEPEGRIQKDVSKILNHIKTVDPSKVGYKVHLRAVKQLQKDQHGKPISGKKPLLAGDLQLPGLAQED